MNRKRFSLVMLMLFMSTLVGCGVQTDQTQTRQHHRLFDEIRSLTATRNQLQSDLKNAREEAATLNDVLLQVQLDNEAMHAEIMQLRQERSELKRHLANRTNERDQHAASLQELRQGIKVLLDRADASLAPASQGEEKLTTASFSKTELE